MLPCRTKQLRLNLIDTTIGDAGHNHFLSEGIPATTFVF
jgi:hypothetical protein